MTTKFAFLFPGQGSQTVGMGEDVYTASQAAKRVFDVVDEALGFSLSSVCFHGPDDELRATINAQPAIVTVSLAFLAAFQEALSSQTSSWSSPLTPTYTAGHSVGECTAVVASGAAELKDIILMVRERGRFMHQEGIVCPGGMAAIIGMEDHLLQEICLEATAQSTDAIVAEGIAHPGVGKVVVANYNAAGQIVISGEKRALERACELATDRGAKRVMPLSVSGAFHSPAMQPASEKLIHVIEQTAIHYAPIPIISNITGQPLHEGQEIKSELSQQIAMPVQWVRSIEYLANAGVKVFIEIGPGKVLSGMVKRIVSGATIINIGKVPDIEKAVTRVREIGLIENV